MVSKKAAPIEKKYDENVKFVLDEALSIIAGKLESTNFSQVSKFMHFTGGASLMFKFERFNRFSEDLDFSLSYSERNNRKVVDMAEDLISESIKELERSITKKRKILVFESEGDWRSVWFLGADGQKKSVKIDFMFSEVVGYEVLFKNGITIRKASDVDIVANKFMRLSRNDLRDIEFLAKQEMNGPDVFAELIFKAIESKIIAKKENPRSKFADLHRLWVSKRNDGRMVEKVLSIFLKSKYAE